MSEDEGTRVTTVTVMLRVEPPGAPDGAVESIDAPEGVAVDVVSLAAAGAALPHGAESGRLPHRTVVVPHGASRARAGNLGLDAATGDWLVFLDADDRFAPGHLGRMLAAQREAPAARLIHSIREVPGPDGRPTRTARPFNLLQLYETDYIRLSGILFSAELVRSGCRFDETLPACEDWDFLVQLAQQTRPLFAQPPGFAWGDDIDLILASSIPASITPEIGAAHERLQAKWALAHDVLGDWVSGMLQEASERARAGDLPAAEARAREILTGSPNNPWALNLLAMLERATGRIEDAYRTQLAAVSVRADDASLVYNLAQAAWSRGDREGAQRFCAHALVLAPGYPPAVRLQAVLDAAGQPPGAGP